MRRRTLLWLAGIAAIAVLVAGQVLFARRPDGAAPAPVVKQGTDVLAGVRMVEARIRGFDYRRSAFGDSWDDDNAAPGGHNGCDTRNDILDRDLVDKTYVSTPRCGRAVAAGTLRDPYTNTHVAFVRGNQVGASVQIDHIVPLAFAWDMGARDWNPPLRKRFANDPANLIAVAGRANQDKGDLPPAEWMPPNRAFWCQYAVQFSAVVRGYRLSLDTASAATLRDAVAECPTG